MLLRAGNLNRAFTVVHTPCLECLWMSSFEPCRVWSVVNCCTLLNRKSTEYYPTYHSFSRGRLATIKLWYAEVEDAYFTTYTLVACSSNSLSVPRSLG